MPVNKNYLTWILDKKQDPNIVLADIPLYVRRHSSMDTSVNYNPRPRPSSFALAKVKEEPSS